MLSGHRAGLREQVAVGGNRVGRIVVRRVFVEVRERCVESGRRRPLGPAQPRHWTAFHAERRECVTPEMQLRLLGGAFAKRELPTADPQASPRVFRHVCRGRFPRPPSGLAVSSLPPAPLRSRDRQARAEAVARSRRGAGQRGGAAVRRTTSRRLSRGRQSIRARRERSRETVDHSSARTRTTRSQGDGASTAGAGSRAFNRTLDTSIPAPIAMHCAPARPISQPVRSRGPNR